MKKSSLPTPEQLRADLRTMALYLLSTYVNQGQPSKEAKLAVQRDLNVLLQEFGGVEPTSHAPVGPLPPAGYLERIIQDMAADPQLEGWRRRLLDLKVMAGWK